MAPVVSEMVVASAVVKVEDILFMFVQDAICDAESANNLFEKTIDACVSETSVIPDNLPIAIPRPRRDGSTTSSVCVYEFGSEKHMFMHNSLLSWWKKGGKVRSSSEHPDKKRNLNTSAKLAQAKSDKYSEEAEMSKDTSDPESPEELRRGWYVEGQIRSGVISPLLAQRYQETFRQRTFIPIYLSLRKKAKSMVESQLAEEEVRGLEPVDDGTETLKGLTELVLQTQTTLSPSPAFVKENINVLRTMIKEHDHHTKTKATPRKLIYANSDREAPDLSMTKSFTDSTSSPPTRLTHMAKPILPVKVRRVSSKAKNRHTIEGQGDWRTGAELRKEPEG
ncbi:hypothetical protein Tco_0577862 [Tanacetum coccineum]